MKTVDEIMALADNYADAASAADMSRPPNHERENIERRRLKEVIEAALKEREGEAMPVAQIVYAGDECGTVEWLVHSGRPISVGQHLYTAPPKAQPISDAAVSVLAERQRQISVEGWTPEHDDTHNSCELPAAAACYALCSTDRHIEELKVSGARVWPWSRSWWKPKTYRANLVKAGALILAEIERIDRAAERHHKIGE